MLLLVFILAATALSQLPKLTIDVTNEGFFHPDSDVIVNYNRFRDQYGREEVIIISIEPENIFDLSFLKRLQALHEELEDNLPYLDDITSLINARNTRGRR